MAKITLILIWILLLASSTLLVIYYGNFTNTEKQFSIETPDKLTINVSSQLSMFLPQMRFNTNNISYGFVECSNYSKSRMKNAFQIISNETKNIFFYENQTPKIIIYCSEQKQEKRNSTFVAGEGGPNKVIILDLYPLIVDGKIYLYKQQIKNDCVYPIVEIHELLHVFGFDHINDSKKVLYPYVLCEQRLTQDIISTLKNIYSDSSKSDLVLNNLTATTHGAYLDFGITILNRGLITANNVSIKIFNGEKEIDTIKIENLEPGVSQTLTVKNLLTKTFSIKQLTFKTTTSSEEYFYENNQLTASVA